MEKFTFEQSKELMKVITLLLELNVITLPIYALVSIDLAAITNLDKRDYLQMDLKLFQAKETTY